MAYNDRDMDRPANLVPDRESQIAPDDRVADDRPRQSEPGDKPLHVAPEADDAAGLAQVSYDPLKEYDPQIEFGILDQQRNNVDQRLGKVTSPFISKIIRIYVISAVVMAWTAVIMPIVVWIGWPFLLLPDYLQIALIVGPPIFLLAGLFAWRFFHVRIRLKWARVDLERYVADKVALRLNEDNGRWSGAIDGMGANSETALLELLRIRPRAFHIWHRISVHPIMMSIKLRGPLETRMLSPRFFVVVLPVITILFFLAYNLGVASSASGAAAPAGAGAWQAVILWTENFWKNISRPAVSLGWGPQVPLFLVFLAAFVLAYRGFHNARSIHGYIMMKIGKTLENANKLTPFSHDCSKRIIHKHHLLLRLFTRMMWYGRHGGGSVRDMFEDLRPELGEIGMDFELSRDGRRRPSPGRSADSPGRGPLTRIGERDYQPVPDFENWPED